MNDVAAIVYIVDDEPDVRRALIRSIEKKGYIVQAFDSAYAFLENYPSGQTGCVILDVRMPGMSGLELQEELLRREIILPIIFISGHGDISMSVRAIKDGAFDFLEKPYHVDALLERIDGAIEESHRRQSVFEFEFAIKQRYDTLTSREQDVMKLLVAGAANVSNKEIARVLSISHRTVDTHRSRIMDKMQARSVSELVEMAKVCSIYIA
ncbi:MAG: response regulator transcription factor [Granulosicoccus sp.]